jgi:hypothetical protein
MKNSLTAFLFSLVILVGAVPAFSLVTVTSPANQASVVSPFALSATASACSSQPITSMGYSIDNSSNTTIIKGTVVIAQVTATTGAHIMHVKSWGNQGASCTTNVAITVVPPAAATIPANAITVSGIHALTNWLAEYDTGTGSGSSTGIMNMVSSPSISGTARQFLTTYTNNGGERYHISFAKDQAATNFLYDTWLYIASPNTGISNIEMDMNETMVNGQTVIFGFQCDGWSSTWDYTANTGTPQAPKGSWLHSTAYCNPRKWTTDTWHHVQVSYSRDDQGWVTYQTVWFDGVQQDLGYKVMGAYALGWGSSLVTNFQVDGLGAYGSSNVYMDNLTVSRW